LEKIRFYLFTEVGISTGVINTGAVESFIIDGL